MVYILENNYQKERHMKIVNLAKGIDQLTIDIENILFEGLWEMPKGVTLNSYIVKGEDIAIVDGFCGWDGVPETLFKLFDQLSLDVNKVKYLVLNHLEPDHSGWITEFKKIHSNFEVICTDKGAELYKAFFGEDEVIHIVNDTSSLDLGDGKVLKFVTTPHVHWPDAMLTYEASSGILFSCDAFGMFGTFERSTFDDDYTDKEIQNFQREINRYYANIIGAFSPFVLKAIEKCKNIEINMIAPGHGLIWRRRKDWILETYQRLAHNQRGEETSGITLLWGSMYGMTEAVVVEVENKLKASGIDYHIHRVPETSWGELLTSVWTSKGVILAMPTYEYKMFPPMAAAFEEIGKKKAQGKIAFRFGSYGWSGGAQKELDEIHDKLRMGWHFVAPYEFKGRARQEDIEHVLTQVDILIRKVKESE